MIELPNQEQMQALLMQDQMRQASEDQMRQASVNQFVAETACRIYAALVAGDAEKVVWNNPTMAIEKLRALARRSRDAAPFLAEALGMMTVKERPNANADPIP